MDAEDQQQHNAPAVTHEAEAPEDHPAQDPETAVAIVDDDPESHHLETDDHQASNVYITAVNLPEEGDHIGNLFQVVYTLNRQQNLQGLFIRGN